MTSLALARGWSRDDGSEMMHELPAANNIAATKVVIVGGGPAGMVLGLLLARAGLQVTVLERNPDFEREFRGEILQPRFMRVAEQADILDIIRAIPHETFSEMRLFLGPPRTAAIQIKKIDKRFPFVTWMTQPMMLKGLHEAARTFPNFKLVFDANVQQITWDQGVCTGVEYDVLDQHHKIDAHLVVGADGRFSKIRRLGAFELEYAHHELDVIWFETNRPKSYTHGADFFLSADFPIVLLPKAPGKIQCGILVDPGAARSLLQLGAESLARKLNETHPMFEEFSKSLVDLHAFTVLDGKIEFVKEWAKNGLLLIGDAAHTCSPAGAIGVTIATETAVVAAREIIRCARLQRFSRADLAPIQASRSHEIRTIHRFQRGFVNNIRKSRGMSRTLLTSLLFLLIKTGIAPRLMRNILTRSTPL